MGGTVVGVAWAVAGALGVIVLAFAGYEVSWKSRRLGTDLRRLETLRTELAGVRAEAEAALRRGSPVGRHAIPAENSSTPGTG